MEHEDLLIALLLDKGRTISVRDDTAMDLSHSTSRYVLDALVTVAREADEDETLVATCGESAVEIMVRCGWLDLAVIDTFAPAARAEALDFLRRSRTETTTAGSNGSDD